MLFHQALEVSIVYEVFDDLDSPDMDYPKPSLSVVAQHQQSGSMGSYSSNASDSAKVGPGGWVWATVNGGACLGVY